MNNALVTYVLLADVVGSRKIKARQDFDIRLQAGLDAVKAEHADAFALSIKTWKGVDEIAAAFKTFKSVYAVINSLQDAVAPEKLRFVIVKGEIDVMPEDNDIRHADGPVFHQAAAQMAALKKKELLFWCDTGNELWDKAMMTQVNLLMLVKDGWTEKQRKIYVEYGKTGRQEAVAQQLAVTQQTVSKTLKAIKAEQVKELEAAFIDWCNATTN